MGKDLRTNSGPNSARPSGRAAASTCAQSQYVLSFSTPDVHGQRRVRDGHDTRHGTLLSFRKNCKVARSDQCQRTEESPMRSEERRVGKEHSEREEQTR